MATALYQQGNQKIEIIVRKQGGGDLGGSKGDRKKDPSESASNKSIDKEGKMRARQTRMIRVNASHAVAVAKQAIGYTIEYQVGGIGYENGDNANQAIVGREMEKFKDGSNLVTAVAIGATYGASGGPTGMVLGASWQLISQSSALIAKYSTRQREYNAKMFKQDHAIEYKKARAQLNLTTGRLR